ELAAMYKELGVTPHPILTLPSLEQVQAVLAAPDGRALLIEHLQKRQRRIQLAEQDPLGWGFEAETWADADRLLLECSILAIFGGNRAQKTWYAVKRALQCAEAYPGTVLLIMREKDPTSIATVQKLVWFYIHNKYQHLNGRRDVKGGAKINYSPAGGFTESKLILPGTLSEIYFPNYNQSPGDWEGLEFGAPADVFNQVSERLRAEGKFAPPNIGAVADESMPLSWLQMFARRIKFRRAKLVWTFTPINGITPAIKELVGNSAEVVESRPSELLPRKNLPGLPDGHMPYIQKCTFPNSRAIYFFTC